MKAKSCGLRKTGSFVEQIQVVQCELLGNWLLNFNDGHVLLAIAIISCEFDKAWSSLALNRELNMIWLCDDGERLRKRLKLFADFGEFTWVYGNKWAILGLWNWKMLDIKRDQVESELGASLSLWVLKNNLECAWILISLKGDGITWVSKFHNLWEVCNVDSENDVLVASVRLESLHAQIERNQCDVGCVHSL